MTKDKIYLLGLGQSGMSVARYLNRNNQSFIALDTRDRIAGFNELKSMPCCIDIRLGELASDSLLDARQIIISPGLSPQIPAVKNARESGAEVIGDVEIFCRQLKKRNRDAKVIAITGSNGKSTVTDLIYQLLKAAGANVEMGGNFGIPVLDFEQAFNSEFYVLELSSFQLDTCYSLKAEVAICLNITPDHLDRYDEFDSYAQSKQKIYEGASVCVFNKDDKRTYPKLGEEHNSTGRVLSFSLLDQNADACLIDREEGVYLRVKGNDYCRTSELKLSGAHNHANALVSLLALTAAGIAIDSKVLSSLQAYEGLAHRYQLIRKSNEVDWVDDSKATNTGSTIAALKALKQADYQTVILIAGGDAKGAELTELAEPINAVVDVLIALGKDKAQLMALDVNCEKCSVDSMQQAVEIAAKRIQGKSLVLLSPACASLDMYPNYMARGEDFRQQVEAVA